MRSYVSSKSTNIACTDFARNSPSCRLGNVVILSEIAVGRVYFAQPMY